MEIRFKTKKLVKVLGSEKETFRSYGPDNGKRIQRRLQNILHSETLEYLSKLPQTRVHELTGNLDETISVDVKHPYRLLMVPDHDPIPRKEDGGFDWSRITKVMITEIRDTH
jgi:proteic killer suppression protein